MGYSPYHFALFRILFGSYLAVYFALLLPYSAELFSPDSFFVRAERSGFQFRQVFPSLLDRTFVADHASLFLGFLSAAALLFAVGIARRISAVVVWYGLSCLVNRNPGIMNPSHAFVGWLCLASAVVPAGEPWGLSARREEWVMPPALYWASWWVMSLAYSASGIAKLGSSGWIDGTALLTALDMPYVRHSPLGEMLKALPESLSQFSTWSVLAVELAFAPLALFGTSRRFAWYTAVFMHFVLFLLFDFWELSVGMLLLHMFTFDDRWLPESSWLTRFSIQSSGDEAASEGPYV